ncbi:MAG: restriction endonuclease subunit S [Acidobacteria bacterium]|nr:restriction endonuclease subunit S [Acidobacteriota bacterium]
MENIESWTGRLLPLDEEFIPTGTSNRFDQGQVLFGKLRPYLAKATIADRSGGCSTELMVFEPKEFDNRFLLYLILSDGFIKLVDSSTQGSKMPRADWEFIGNIEVAYPPLPEQRAIATYLDERTARIDGLVARQRRLVQLLKEKRQALITRAVTRGLNPKARMKDSGVPWLGKVPEGWEVKPLRYLGTFQNGISAGAEYFGSGYPFVNYKDVYQWPELPKEVEGLANSTPDDQSRYSVESGDVLFTRTSETSEEIGIASTCTQTISEAIFSGFLIRFRPFPGTLSPAFSKHYFRCDVHRSFFAKEMNLVTRASLGQELLKRLPVLIPPLDEQKSIARWIDERCKDLDTLITKVEQAIERLQEYRTALISAAVTGKVRVPAG